MMISSLEKKLTFYETPKTVSDVIRVGNSVDFYFN